MLSQPIKKTKIEYIRNIIVMIIIGVLIWIASSLFPYFTAKDARGNTVSGVVVGYKDGGARRGYFYYTNTGESLNSYYFFVEKNANNILIGDSIYKPANSFKLYIYRKDSTQQYVEHKVVQVYADSISDWDFFY